MNKIERILYVVGKEANQEGHAIICDGTGGYQSSKGKNAAIAMLNLINNVLDQIKDNTELEPVMTTLYVADRIGKPFEYFSIGNWARTGKNSKNEPIDKDTIKLAIDVFVKYSQKSLNIRLISDGNINPKDNKKDIMRLAWAKLDKHITSLSAPNLLGLGNANVQQTATTQTLTPLQKKLIALEEEFTKALDADDFDLMDSIERKINKIKSMIGEQAPVNTNSTEPSVNVEEDFSSEDMKGNDVSSSVSNKLSAMFENVGDNVQDYSSTSGGFGATDLAMSFNG